jgi:integrase
MARRKTDRRPAEGRPVTGSIEIRPFKSGDDASFWLRVTVDGQRRSRRLGRASEGWTPVLAEAERKRVVDEIAAGVYREPEPEVPLEERDPTFHLGVTLRHADGRRMQLSPKTINHAIVLLSAILGAAVRDDDLDPNVNPADDRRLRLKIPKKSARDFLEADEVLSLLVAGEIVDNPVKPETAAAAAEVGRLRDTEHLTWNEIARRLKRSQAGAIWLYSRHAIRCPSPSRALIAILAASGVRNTEACQLCWSDLDFTHGKINVGRSKTRRGVREIDMIPWLREELLSLRTAIGKPDLHAPVFPTRDGTTRTKDNLNRTSSARSSRPPTPRASSGACRHYRSPSPHTRSGAPS